ncbi:MAG: helix-turn-helix domain-containing protein, partial [Chitinophagaceae bacterium]|nr:helix-turn-helix domain-containing protein [Chitinophagaceae bacterium]
RHFIIPANLLISPKPYPTRPEQCMTFYIRGSEVTEIPSGQYKMMRPRSVISGQYTERINRYSGSREFLMLQVVFLPGAIYRLTGVPSHKLQGTFENLEDVFPVESNKINERLENCNSYNEIIFAIEEFLLGLLKKTKIEEKPADQIFRIMLKQPSRYSISWLAKEACYSLRQFERKAYDHLGICPKTFLRISRFIQSYDMRIQHPKMDWLSIALAFDYHDYQHLAKEYKEFAGAKPNELFAAESQSLERMLGLKK